MDFLRRIGLSALDLIYPPSCFLCGTYLKEHRYICSECIDDFREIEPPLCERCGRPTGGVKLCDTCARGDRGFHLARSYGYFLPEDDLGEAISGLKYEREKALARDLAPLFLRGTTAELVRLASWITYVPQTKSKKEKRGFNQAKLLAESLADLTDIPLLDHLEKTKDTPPQVSLGREERFENLEGAFKATGDAFDGPILLVDDVFTTGATLSECGKALRETGWKKIYAVTLARSTHDRP